MDRAGDVPGAAFVFGRARGPEALAVELELRPNIKDDRVVTAGASASASRVTSTSRFAGVSG
jgi:hypothetical protein